MKYFFLSLLIIILAIFVFSPFIAKADDFCKSGIVPCGRNCDNPDTPNIDERKPCTLCHFIVGFWNLISYGFKIMVFLALACLVIAGIMYITSAGSEKMMETAKTFIKQILFGFGIVLLGWVFIFTVMNYFAVKIKSEEGGFAGLQKESWTKFTCNAESSGAYQGSFDGGGGGTADRFFCRQGQCVASTDGSFLTEAECKTSCSASCQNWHEACGGAITKPCCDPYKCVEYGTMGQKWCNGDYKFGCVGGSSGAQCTVVKGGSYDTKAQCEPYCKGAKTCGNDKKGTCQKCTLACAVTQCPGVSTRYDEGSNPCSSGYICCAFP